MHGKTTYIIYLRRTTALHKVLQFFEVYFLKNFLRYLITLFYKNLPQTEGFLEQVAFRDDSRIEMQP